MRLGILGGSGLYELEGLQDIRWKKIRTPLGKPSDAFMHGRLKGREIVFLPRHARGHRILPSEINHRANIYAFKKLGVSRIISVSAVGSLKQELRPRDIVLPDQYFDRTKKSLEHTFFGNGIVGHVAFGDPTCGEWRKIIAASAKKVLARHAGKEHVKLVEGGTYVNMEGPHFSTRAESNAYRRNGSSIIGMTSLGEAKLCREAGICYQAMAMVTDYDCWHESEEPVTVDMIIGNLLANVKLAKEILVELIGSLPEKSGCACSKSLENAIMTAPGAIPARVKKALAPILRGYVK
ncbi:MAG: S-methyl-5'-thioadenosine phosphorylase [Verrucomicrobia bacterium]|nr:S-methyl-5'-thioadenosine phosphorylase [Verrucomicrobiota bacterium]